MEHTCTRLKTKAQLLPVTVFCSVSGGVESSSVFFLGLDVRCHFIIVWPMIQCKHGKEQNVYVVLDSLFKIVLEFLVLVIFVINPHRENLTGVGRGAPYRNAKL